MSSYSKILKCPIIIFKKGFLSWLTWSSLVCFSCNILNIIRINLQADVFLKKLSPLAICMCVFWLWSAADIPPFFHHNLHCLMGTKCTYFLWAHYLSSLFFSLTSLSLVLVPLSQFFFSIDSISTGKCQKISHSRHTQELSVSGLPQG